MGDMKKKNTDKVNKANVYVKSQGVDAKDIKTSGYNVNPRYQYYPCNERTVCPPASIVGYEVSQTVTVKVRDFAKVGALLAGVVTEGANSVSSLVFRQEDPAASQNEARQEAITEAKVHAKAVAKAGGFRLGKLLSIEEAGGYYPMYAYGRGGAEADSVQNVKLQAAPVIEPGTEEVRMQVVLRYEIK